jgi:hypothetical protein
MFCPWTSHFFGPGRFPLSCAQGDQMSLRKIAQNVAQPIFLQILIHNLKCGKCSPHFWATFVNFQKQPKGNNYLLGESGHAACAEQTLELVILFQRQKKVLMRSFETISAKKNISCLESNGDFIISGMCEKPPAENDMLEFRQRKKRSLPPKSTRGCEHPSPFLV